MLGAEFDLVEPVAAIACHPEGSIVAMASAASPVVSIWDWRSGRRIADLKHGSFVYDVDFTPDGKRLATACQDNSIRLWDAERWDQVAVLRGHRDYVHAVAFAPDGMQLASASGDHTIRIWDTSPPRARGKRLSPNPRPHN